MFFVFFGTRQRRQVLGTGTFDCPFCTVPRTYEHRTSRTWGHVFWVPLFPLGNGFESVRCTVCHGEWDPTVLRPASPQDGWAGPATSPQDRWTTGPTGTATPQDT